MNNLNIHPTAIVNKKAIIDESAEIGPYSIIGENVSIGRDVKIHAHVVIDGYTSIDEGTEIYPFAAIGLKCQDLKYKGEKSILSIGKNCQIREHATMHPGTNHGGGETIVGDNCLLMIGTHIAHDCILGNNIIMANNATLGGHVIIENNAIIGGLSAVQQFSRIGEGSMLGGMSGIKGDLIPFGIVKNTIGDLAGLNVIGMRRAGISNEEIRCSQKLYDILFNENDNRTINEIISSDEAIELSKNCEPVQKIINFIKNKSKRPLCRPKKD